MCAKKEPRDVLQPIADLDEEFYGEANTIPLRRLLLNGERPYSSAWVGAQAYYGLLESI